MNSSVKIRKLNPQESEALFQYFTAIAGIPRIEFDELEKFISAREFPKSAYFVKVGDLSRNVGFVLRGGFTVSYVNSEGDSLIRNFCIAGMPLGSYGTILSNQPTHVNIEAFEPSTVAVLDYDKLSSFYDRHSSWERFGRKIAEQHYMTRERREYQLLSLSAKERYEAFLNEFPGLDERVTQACIAAYIGISPVSLSRILGVLRKKS